MRPSGQVALDLGPPFDDGAPSDSDFEEIPHPAAHNAYWTQHPPAHPPQREEELPLHYMSQENARRRVARGRAEDEGVVRPVLQLARLLEAGQPQVLVPAPPVVPPLPADRRHGQHRHPAPRRPPVDPALPEDPSCRFIAAPHLL